MWDNLVVCLRDIAQIGKVTTRYRTNWQRDYEISDKLAVWLRDIAQIGSVTTRYRTNWQCDYEISHKLAVCLRDIAQIGSVTTRYRTNWQCDYEISHKSINRFQKFCRINSVSKLWRIMKHKTIIYSMDFGILNMLSCYHSRTGFRWFQSKLLRKVLTPAVEHRNVLLYRVRTSRTCQLRDSQFASFSDKDINSRTELTFGNVDLRIKNCLK